ncbi:MAG: hypothetical protein JXB62_05980 [Pirellulales bacterium]|nr:hypothetical protein [Pirellulales bacterium]
MLRARVRRLVTVHGASWVIATVLGLVLILGVSDYWIRIQDRGLRILCSLAVFGALAWSCYRFLYLPLTFRLRDIDLASRLQGRFPALGDRLISAIEFLRQAEDDPLAGSAAMRRAVIAQTTAESDRLDFGEMLDRRAPLRGVLVGVAVCLVAAILVVLDPLSSRIAVARLVNPFGNAAWPQKTHLQLRKVVTRVARGQSFEVEVIDAQGAKLPREVRIIYRFEGPDGNVAEETELMQPADKAAKASRPNVVRRFSYRVAGGDDETMPWIAVDVVEPPQLAALVIRFVPPAYTGWLPEKASRHIRGLVGTQVEISATASRPLKSAVLCLDNGQRIDAGPAGPQQQSVAAEFVLQEDMRSWWFELRDQEDLAGGSDVRGEIRAVPDSPPTVAVEQPTAGLFVTARAVVPLRVVAKDDLAVRQVALVFSDAARPEAEGSPPPETVLPLFTGPPQAPSQAARGLSGGAEASDRRVVQYRWDLAELALAAGDQLMFHATAADYLPQTTASEPRRLTIITPEELQSRIADREARIVTELARVLKMQRASRADVASLEIRLDELGYFGQTEVDRLLPAELNQRQVHRELSSRDEGVPMHVLALLADLDNNRVDSPDVRRRMHAVLDEIERLDRDHLTLIGRELTTAIKAARVGLQQRSERSSDARATTESLPSDAQVAGSLTGAGRHQDQVIEALQQMLDQLAQWDNYRRFHREISELLRDQEELDGRAAEVGRQTLTKQWKDLQPREKADLRVLTKRQLELALRFDRIQQAMQQTSAQLEQSDPLAAQTVADALAEARRLAISGQMRSAGEHLEQNQIGQAARLHEQIAQALRDVLDILANRRQHELVRLIEKLKKSQSDLAQIEKEHAETQAQLDAEVGPVDDAQRRRLEQLSEQLQRLQRDTEQMARRLQRLLAPQAGRTTAQAAGQMGQAGQCAAAGNCQGARQTAAEARKSLEEAMRQLGQRIARAQAELATEQLAQLQDALKHLRRQQENLLDETGRYERQRQSQGQLSRAQAAGLRDLARQQQWLQGETAQLADTLIGAGAFHLALSGAAGDMGRAAELLQRRQTGAATEQAQQHAMQRLDLLREALEPEPPEDGPDNGQNTGSGGAGGDGGGKPGQGAPPGAAQRLAELKLLRLLQQELNLRTEQLQETVTAAGAVTEEQHTQFAELSREQGQLADLVLQLLASEPKNPEDDLDALPDLRLEENNPKLEEP